MAVELAAIVRGELFGSSGDRHDGDPRPAKYDPPRWLQAEGRVRRCRRSSTTFPHRASRRCPPSHATRPACSSTAEAHAPPIIVSSLTFPRCSSPATSSSSTTPASSRRGCGCAETRVATSRCSSYARWKGADGTPSCGRRGASTSARCCDRCIPRATSSRSRSANGWTTRAVGDVRLLADDPLAALDRHGTMPLPPYIHTPLHDPERYQTVYASRPGSVAAPTAGLHLTPGLLQHCRAEHIDVCTVELVVGLDTFRPVVADRPEDHIIHREEYRVPVADPRRVPRRQARRRRRHDDGARARVRGPRAAFGGHVAVHPRRVRLAGRRPADDELPPSALVAAAARRRVRRAEMARRCTTSRWARGIASSRSATRCSSTATRRADDRSTHRRRGDRACRRSRARRPRARPEVRSARRASCRSARGRR